MVMGAMSLELQCKRTLHTYLKNASYFFVFCYRSSDNSRIASGGVDRSVLLFDVGSGEIVRRYTAHWEVKVNIIKAFDRMELNSMHNRE